MALLQPVRTAPQALWSTPVSATAAAADWPLRVRACEWFYRASTAMCTQGLFRVPTLFGASTYRTAPKARGSSPVSVTSGIFGVGHKAKYLLANQERMSVCTNARGKRYVLSQTQVRGGYGKLRIAMDDAGTCYAVKELRLAARANPHGDGTPRATKVSSPERIREELQLTAAASATLHIEDCFEAHGKVLVFLPLMSDDANVLAHVAPDFAKPAIGRLLLAQVVEDLARIHARGYVHHDVKISNILWDANGVALLGDFGLACPLELGSGLSHAPGRTAGNMPLEHLTDQGFNHNLDVFMLGLALADFYAPDVRLRPAPEQVMNEALALASWRRKISKLPRGSRLPALANLSPQEAVWHNFFERVWQQDAPVAAFIVDRMLDDNPRTRADVPEVRAFITALQPCHSPAARGAARIMGRIAANDTQRQRLVRHMHYFRRWLSQHPYAQGLTEHSPAGFFRRSWRWLASRFCVSQ